MDSILVSCPDINTLLLHTFQKGTWPVGSRDLLTVNTLICHSSDHVECISTSVNDEHGPSIGQDGATRASTILAAWCLKKIPTGVEATYIFHVDLKGTIPTGISELI